MNLERIETLNDWLRDNYGLFDNGQPNFRLSWSDDQFEYREGCFAKYDLHGNLLGYENEVKYVPKYRQWIQHKWVLEKIVPVPEINNKELVDKVSYEPVWVFQTDKGDALDPKREAIVLIIHQVQEQLLRKKGLVVYKDPESDPKEAKEIGKKRIENLQKELFGNETEVGDAMAHGQAIIVPRSYGNGN